MARYLLTHLSYQCNATYFNKNNKHKNQYVARKLRSIQSFNCQRVIFESMTQYGDRKSYNGTRNSCCQPRPEQFGAQANITSSKLLQRILSPWYIAKKSVLLVQHSWNWINTGHWLKNNSLGLINIPFKNHTMFYYKPSWMTHGYVITATYLSFPIRSWTNSLDTLYLNLAYL